MTEPGQAIADTPTHPGRPPGPTVGDVTLAAPPLLAARVFLALLLLVGFYALTLLIVVALLFVVWSEFTTGFFNLYVTLACPVGAIALLVALVPRSVEFVEPGPRLTRAEQPRLFAVIDGIARAVGQPAPAEVYMDPEPNARVTQRGGILGRFGRRVEGWLARCRALDIVNAPLVPPA